MNTTFFSTLSADHPETYFGLFIIISVVFFSVTVVGFV